MRIEGRMRLVNNRIAGMTDEERAWRKQWVEDQALADDEPVPVPEIYKELRNPIRRFYQWPLNQLEMYLTPRIGRTEAWVARRCIGATGLTIAVIYIVIYNLTYDNAAYNWTTKRGLYGKASRSMVYPGDPDFPYGPDLYKPTDFYDRGFSQSILYAEQTKKLEALKKARNLESHIK